eukprot:comp17996_c0_seq1/m.31369 comp17996_c0_seq1/g.31369  ORF comp17996_c0_seq1/g.31369 comp17996_c0_seq1/m.31369 type:complete len:314 (+) comp17996_c0_seq1:417-1358(+)
MLVVLAQNLAVERGPLVHNPVAGVAKDRRIILGKHHIVRVHACALEVGQQMIHADIIQPDPRVGRAHCKLIARRAKAQPSDLVLRRRNMQRMALDADVPHVHPRLAARGRHNLGILELARCHIQCRKMGCMRQELCNRASCDRIVGHNLPMHRACNNLVIASNILGLRRVPWTIDQRRAPARPGRRVHIPDAEAVVERGRKHNRRRSSVLDHIKIQNRVAVARELVHGRNLIQGAAQLGRLPLLDARIAGLGAGPKLGSNVMLGLFGIECHAIAHRNIQPFALGRQLPHLEHIIEPQLLLLERLARLGRSCAR